METLDGFSTATNNTSATKQNIIEYLPPVLILHLKRFVFDSVEYRTVKVHKHIAYSKTLHIRPELLAHTLQPTNGKMNKSLEYSLFSVVYHHGKHAAGGHYTCDVRRDNAEWLHIDDDYVEPTSVDEVCKERSDRNAYMLFYRLNEKIQ